MDHHDYVNLLKPAAIRPGAAWADLGAGSGAFTLALRELAGPNAEIFAVDTDRSRLADLERSFEARFREGKGQDGRLHIVHADFTRSLDLPTLDGVLMANALHFFKDKVRVLRQIHSLLQPGGALLLVEYDAEAGNLWVPYPLSFETMQPLLLRCGFVRPRWLHAVPSHFLNAIYSAIAYRPEKD